MGVSTILCVSTPCLTSSSHSNSHRRKDIHCTPTTIPPTVHIQSLTHTPTFKISPPHPPGAPVLHPGIYSSHLVYRTPTSISSWHVQSHPHLIVARAVSILVSSSSHSGTCSLILISFWHVQSHPLLIVARAVSILALAVSF